ncbi:lipopolysaccharide biosynthesis protein [Anabaena subtropica]|uniref:Lipopolysaccharide biosynthesis protein n=1 Tax=Anabaena subtropica FACHB-260 TaxID=2692884 RepID=A0ABR8CQ85_9NOST|nr:lipopolysaccharide biosynthesis protein [Anabaena subtropica]MBD2345355.1 lipopolysaccharide biosynthesis protein [Anabaena subtropica FACHB-260]
MIINKIKQLLSGQFIRNVGWLGTAELVNRIFRLGTTVTLSRMFSSQDYGAMAIIYTIFEFANAFTLRGGIGAKIIQADQEYLATICNTSYWLNWILGISLFCIQCLLAFPIANFYENNSLVLPICVTAISYLTLPLFTVHAALIERENRLKIIAICNAVQSFLTNLITVSLALLGMGIWSIVLAIVLSNVPWIIITRKYEKWKFPKQFSLEKWEIIVNFGRNILGIELLNKIRLNSDYLIIGKFLSIEQLGLYYFAFNAGSGITSNVAYSFISALFPQICAVRQNYHEMKKTYIHGLKLMLFVITFIVTLQTSLAPFYVPIIFGEKWIKAIPILIIICISVVPLTFRWANSTLLKATDRTNLLLSFDIIYTFIFAASILVAVQWGIFGVAITVLVVHSVMALVFGVWAARNVFVKDVSVSYLK